MFAVLHAKHQTVPCFCTMLFGVTVNDGTCFAGKTDRTCMHVLFCSEQQTDQGERHRLPHSHGAQRHRRDGEAHPRERRGGTALSLPRPTRANATSRAAFGAGAVCGASLRARSQR